MYQLIRHTVPLDVRVDLGLMIFVIAEGVKDLSQSHVRKMSRNFLRGDAETPEFNESAHGGARPTNNGLAPQNSFVLKYEFQWSPDLKTWYVNAFPVVLVLQFGLFGAFGLYRGVWRATGIGDLVRIVLVVSAATGFSYALVQVSEVPASVLPFFCIDLLVLGALVVGTRSLYRVLDYSSKVEGSNGSGALIYGAGRGGQLVLRELQQNPALGLRPLGFLDDDPALRKRTINRVPILGASADLASILDKQPVASMVISSDKIHHDRLEAVLSICHARNIPVVHAHLKWEPIWPDGNGGNGGEASALLPANQGDAKRET